MTFDGTDALLTDLVFGLILSSNHVLRNEEFANSLLAGSLNALFDNSLTLLGIEALDVDGRSMSGVSYLASDPDIVLPVWGARGGAVPEPATLALAAIALVALSLGRRRADGSMPAERHARHWQGQ